MSNYIAQMETSPDGSIIVCTGAWTVTGMQNIMAKFSYVLRRTRDQVQIHAEKIQDLDTFGAVNLCGFIALAQSKGKKINILGFKKNHQLIFDLVNHQYLQTADKNLPVKTSLNSMSLLGCWSTEKVENTYRFLSFIGEVLIQFLTISGHGLRYLWRACLKIIQTSGCEALPIVGMLSFLVGIVLAYQLGQQLQVYGASIYVVDASAIAILREFAPLMTAIIIAGRTSTSFAAFIGAMKVNDELDALSTMGVSAVERLVLPRVAGLVIALPLLVIWSIFFSLLGSMIMAASQFGISYSTFIERFVDNVTVDNYVLGIVKAPVFALIISLVGCFQGFQTGISADSVGVKTTTAAVQSIFLIIVADAFFSILYSWQGL
jgi:phospholipid/cholesterol/gamma-HCH transport system permease protein